MIQLTERAKGVLIVVAIVIAFTITGTIDAQACQNHGLCP